MSGKGNCYDAAAVKTFFRTIKAQLIWRRSWETRRQAEMAIFEYINGFYNPRRRHSALGWKSPVAFERKVALTSTWGSTKPRQVHVLLHLAVPHHHHGATDIVPSIDQSEGHDMPAPSRQNFSEIACRGDGMTDLMLLHQVRHSFPLSPSRQIAVQSPAGQ